MSPSLEFLQQCRNKLDRIKSQGIVLDYSAFSLCSPSGRCKENQDNFLIMDDQGLMSRILKQNLYKQVDPQWPQGSYRFAVCDGIGGLNDGILIAEAVVAEISQLPTNESADFAGKLDALHLKLNHEWRAPLGCAGTTLTMLDVNPTGQASLYHVGNSRLYAISANKVRCLTLDHVPATRLLVHKHLTATQWYRLVHYRHSRGLVQGFVTGSNLVHSRKDLTALDHTCLPASLACRQDRRKIQLQPGVLYLLATDGLWDTEHPQPFIKSWPALYRKNPTTKAFITALQQQVKAAVAGNNASGFRDNTTAVAFKLR